MSIIKTQRESNLLPVYFTCVFCGYEWALWTYMPKDREAAYTCRRCGRKIFFKEMRRRRRAWIKKEVV